MNRVSFVMKSIKAFVIEEEVESLQILQKFAEDNSILISICGFKDNLEESKDLINRHKPELIFINAKDENLKFFHVFNNIDFVVPKIILMSQNIDKAYKAFQLNAVGFLLKPLDFKDIITSVYKALKFREMELSFQKLQVQKIDAINSLNEEKKYVAISSMDKIDLVKTETIVYCKADGKYTEFILEDGNKILSTKNLGEYTQILNQNYFFRIHHSYVINIKHIVKISKKDGYICEFPNGLILPVAKRRMDAFAKFINL